jgi:hypothetical protein
VTASVGDGNDEWKASNNGGAACNPRLSSAGALRLVLRSPETLAFSPLFATLDADS